MAVVQMSAIPRFYAARKGAGAPVLTHDGHTVTWGELEARANRRARLFAGPGVKAGDFVTIALPNGNEFFETTFAVWKLGATPNPVPSKLPRTEFSAIIDLVRPSLVVGGEEQAVSALLDLRKGGKLGFGGVFEERIALAVLNTGEAEEAVRWMAETGGWKESSLAPRSYLYVL